MLKVIQGWLNLPKGLTGRVQHSLQITAQNQVLKILKASSPFLIVKLKKAQEAIAFIESKGRYISKRRRVLIRVT